MIPFNKFTYHSYAFLSAFVTNDSFKEPGIFIDKVKDIFLDYRDSLDEITKSAHAACTEKPFDLPDRDCVLYTPVPYLLFGDFDLAIFSLIDDFSFASREFKPRDLLNFKYQVNTGIIPLLEIYTPEHSQMKRFTETYLPGLFTNTNFYPFTCIASIKLNNSMLAGVGQDFITLMIYYIITLLDKQIEIRKQKGLKLFYILNENLGSNELNLHFFGNSMEQMNELLFLLRTKKLGDLKTDLEKLRSNETINPGLLKETIDPIFEKLREESLLADLIGTDNKVNAQARDILQSHPIIATAASFGYHPDLLDWVENQENSPLVNTLTADELQILKDECNSPSLTVAWQIKPGHERAASEVVINCLPPRVKELMNAPGETQWENPLTAKFRTSKFSFIFPFVPISIFEYLQFSNAGSRTENEGRLQNNVIKYRSRLLWWNNLPGDAFDPELHYTFDLPRYCIAGETAKWIKKCLLEYPISFTQRGQLENILINFNDAITDPLMYNYFIGLRKALSTFIAAEFTPLIDSTTKPSGTTKNTPDDDEGYFEEKKEEEKTQFAKSIDQAIITAFIQAWNKAYWNRYFHSNYFSDLNDFNIEHHGGVQQILFTYDTIYKTIARRIYGGDSKEPFVFVQASPIITSTQYYNSINFTHLYRPGIYACECVHEAANHLIPYLVNQRKQQQYKFLLNPNKDFVEFDQRPDTEAFEIYLKKFAAIRNLEEEEFIETQFGLNAMRYLVTDYTTYQLAYSGLPSGGSPTVAENGPRKLQSIAFYYRTHWYLLLTRADSYARLGGSEGAWFYRPDEFRSIFIRFNLMFYLLLDLSESDLHQLNQDCPSAELGHLWPMESSKLIEFTIRLGKAVRKEFNRRSPSGDRLDGLKKRVDCEWDEFKRIIDELLEEKYNDLSTADQSYYQQIISLNAELIEQFHNLVYEKGKNNIIIRTNQSQTLGKIQTNIRFLENPNGRSVFLDPKGHQFVTLPGTRKEILQANIQYLKKSWDLCMQIVRTFYEIEKR